MVLFIYKWKITKCPGKESCRNEPNFILCLILCKLVSPPKVHFPSQKRLSFLTSYFLSNHSQSLDFAVYTGSLKLSPFFTFRHADQLCVKFYWQSFRDMHMIATCEHLTLLKLIILLWYIQKSFKWNSFWLFGFRPEKALFWWKLFHFNTI